MRVRILICTLLMTVSALIAVAAWGMEWGSLVVLIIGGGCLFSMIYSWKIARKIDRQLERINRHGSK